MDDIGKLAVNLKNGRPGWISNGCECHTFPLRSDLPPTVPPEDRERWGYMPGEGDAEFDVDDDESTPDPVDPATAKLYKAKL